MPDTTSDDVRMRHPREVNFDPLPSGPDEPRHRLIPMKPTGDSLAVFLVHGGFGHVFTFKRLVEHVREDIPVFAFEARGVRDDLPPYTSLVETASAYIEEMRRVRPAGPYLVGGFSNGGAIAWEIAQQLTAAGQDVRLLIIDVGPRADDLPRFSLPRRAGRIIAYHWKNWRGLEGRGRRSYRSEAFRGEVSRLAGFLHLDPEGRLYALSLRFGRKPTPGRLQVYRAALAARADWEFESYPRHFTLFRAELQDPSGPEYPTLGFTPQIAPAGFDIRHIPGSHTFLFVEPNVFHLGAELEDWVDRQQHGAPASVAANSVLDSQRPPHTSARST